MLVRNKISFIISLLVIVGCSSVGIQNYIKADHPYIRKISGEYDKILASVKETLANEGFAIQEEVNPSEYERREGGEDQSKDKLFFTRSKRRSRILYSTYIHLNVYVHPTADGAEIDLRYEAFIPGALRPSSTRNDKIAYKILDEIEQSLESK